GWPSHGTAPARRPAALFLLATPAIAVLTWLALNPPEPDHPPDRAVSVQVVDIALPSGDGLASSLDNYEQLVNTSTTLAFTAAALAVALANGLVILRSRPTEPANE
ncbi:hypothetical protein ACFQ07_19340, partial [Actinomadura adrarensis]